MAARGNFHDHDEDADEVICVYDDRFKEHSLALSSTPTYANENLETGVQRNFISPALNSGEFRREPFETIDGSEFWVDLRNQSGEQDTQRENVNKEPQAIQPITTPEQDLEQLHSAGRVVTSEPNTTGIAFPRYVAAKASKQPKRYYCRVCVPVFKADTRPAARVHLEVKHGISDVDNLNNYFHSHEVGTYGKFPCLICEPNKLFDSSNGLRKHVYMVHKVQHKDLISSRKSTACAHCGWIVPGKATTMWYDPEDLGHLYKHIVSCKENSSAHPSSQLDDSNDSVLTERMSQSEVALHNLQQPGIVEDSDEPAATTRHPVENGSNATSMPASRPTICGDLTDSIALNPDREQESSPLTRSDGGILVAGSLPSLPFLDTTRKPEPATALVESTGKSLPVDDEKTRDGSGDEVCRTKLDAACLVEQQKSIDEKVLSERFVLYCLLRLGVKCALEKMPQVLLLNPPDQSGQEVSTPTTLDSAVAGPSKKRSATVTSESEQPAKIRRELSKSAFEVAVGQNSEESIDRNEQDIAGPPPPSSQENISTNASEKSNDSKSTKSPFCSWLRFW